MLFFAFITLIIGTYFFNQNGSYTKDNKHRIIALVFNIASVVLFVCSYGLARGIFIYLAVMALVGLLLTFTLSYKNNK